MRGSGGTPSAVILKQAQLQSEARGSTSIRFSGMVTLSTWWLKACTWWRSLIQGIMLPHPISRLILCRRMKALASRITEVNIAKSPFCVPNLGEATPLNGFQPTALPTKLFPFEGPSPAVGVAQSSAHQPQAALTLTLVSRGIEETTFNYRPACRSRP